MDQKPQPINQNVPDTIPTPTDKPEGTAQAINQSISQPLTYPEPYIASPIVKPTGNTQNGIPSAAPFLVGTDVQQPLDNPGPPKSKSDDMLKVIRSFISFIVFVGTVAVTALLINLFVFQAYYVDGSSMNPTLQNNDRLIVYKLDKTITNFEGKSYIPSRGDIITFNSSIVDQTGHFEQLIKRVIGLPGDTVIVANGSVTIKNSQNPKGFDIDKKLGLNLSPTYMESPLQETVPPETVFVMGDNRTPNGSYDSRSFGPVPVGNIQGRLAVRIFPINEWQTY